MALLYLVVYNPTLRPAADSEHEDADDAEEQSHVLFYTAREHAVSKDRVLRQVGLAKALVNFATMFDSQSICDSVHSQSRRMIIISPEPNFWMHACFELAKTPRPVKPNSKGKGKQPETVYDYNEASLHDDALRSRLLLAYEEFKLTHGSFSSILSSIGREGLELQLERFFTTRAWSWDFDRQTPFLEYLGTRVHPLSKQLVPLISTLEDSLPPHYETLVLSYPFLITAKDTIPEYPPSLPRHLLSFTSKPKPPSKLSEPPDSSSSQGKSPQLTIGRNGTLPKRFLGVPSVSVNMDVRKWSWPGYLTFGIGGNKEGDHDKDDKETAKDIAPNGKTEEQTPDNASVQNNVIEGDKTSTSASVNTNALEDALASEEELYKLPSHSPSPSEEANNKIESQDEKQAVEPTQDSPGDEALNSAPQDTADEVSPPLDVTESKPEGSSVKGSLGDASRTVIPTEHTVTAPPPAVQFSETYIHLPLEEGSLSTQRRLVRYLKFEELLFALVPVRSCDEQCEIEDDVLEIIVEKALNLLERLKTIISEEQEKISTAFPSSPVQSLLQKSQHAIVSKSTQTMFTSNKFSSSSWHLHTGRQTLRTDKDILEIYSRGQNPQDWFLVKRGASQDYLEQEPDSDTFMEISRKEASLVDVDNEISGVIRRFLDS